MIQRNLPSNPFVGLRPYESYESILFFGRTEQTAELLDKLGKTRFLAVVGSSGSGKSSLIRAGLIPKLKAGFLVEERDRWFMAMMKPGNQPLYNLAYYLLAAFQEEPDPKAVEELEETIRIRGVKGLLKFLAPRMSKDANLLLLVDQFEEIFRFILQTRGSEEKYDADDFVAMMLELSRQTELPIYVVLTMRSDFIGDCDTFHGLPEALNSSQYLVPRLTRKQRREVIEGPVRLYHKSIAPQLVTRLLNDLGDTDDQLPILQHCLMRTYEFHDWQSDDQLNLDDYRRAGALRNALSHHADEALAGKDKHTALLTKRIFQTLTEIDYSNRGIRRPATIAEIRRTTGASLEEIKTIINLFRSDGRSFLVLSKEEFVDETMVDISHESLIRQWRRLRNWLEEEAVDGRRYTQIVDGALREVSGELSLWKDPELSIALKWQRQKQPTPAWAQRYHTDRYIDFSLVSKAENFLEGDRPLSIPKDGKIRLNNEALFNLAMSFIERSKAEKLAEQKRIRRRQKFVFAAAVVFFLISITALFFWMRAEEAITTAKRETRRADLLYEAATETNKLLEDEKKKTDNLLELTRLKNDTLEIEKKKTQDLLVQTKSIYLELVKEKDKTDALLQITLAKQDSLDKAVARAAELLREAKRAEKEALSIALSSKAIRQRRIGNPETAALLAKEAYEFHEQVQGEFLDQVYEALRTTLNDPKFQENGVGVGGPFAIGTPHQDWVRSVAYSPDGAFIVSGSGDGNIRFWNPSRPNLSSKFIKKHKGAVRDLVDWPHPASGKGPGLISVGEDGKIILWTSYEDGKPRAKKIGQQGGPIWTAAIDTAGQRLVTGGRDQYLLLWDLRNRKKKPLILLDASRRITGTRQINSALRIRAVAFSRDGNLLAAGDDFGELYLWEVKPGAPPRLLQTKLYPDSSAIYSMAFHPQKNILVTGATDAKIRVWEVNPTRFKPLVEKQILRGHTSTVNSLDFSPQGDMLASGSADKSVRLWDFSTEQNISRNSIFLQEHDQWVWSVAFSPDGEMVISGSAEGRILKWISDARLLAEQAARKTAGKELTQEEMIRFKIPPDHHEFAPLQQRISTDDVIQPPELPQR